MEVKYPPQNKDLFMEILQKYDTGEKFTLRGKVLPIICPTCNVDIEHLLYVFFDCNFATQCWQELEMNCDMMLVESAADWLLQKLEMETQQNIIRIATVLWGIWVARIKVIWEEKHITSSLAIEWSSKYISEWKFVVQKYNKPKVSESVSSGTSGESRWKTPVDGQIKLNVDASAFEGVNSYSIGMVLRDNHGVGGKTMRLPEWCMFFRPKQWVLRRRYRGFLRCLIIRS